MTRIRRAWLLCACLAVTAGPNDPPYGVAAQTPREAPPPGFSVDYVDRTVDACTDFYQFACGNWLATHPLPGDRSRLGRLQDLSDRGDLLILAILERAAAQTNGRTPNEQKIGDYFASCMDERAIAARGAAPVLPLLRNIDSVNNRTALIPVAARLHRAGFRVFTGVIAMPNARDSSMLIANIDQGAFGLPDRDLYLREDARSSGLRREYAGHVQRMFALLGRDPAEARVSASAVLEVETALARATLDRVSFRDPRRRDNPMAVEELTALGPNFDFPAFFREIQAPAFRRVNVLHPQYIQDVNVALGTLPLASWKDYLTWQVLSAMAPRLAPAFENERFRFVGTTWSGQREMRPRWRRCTAAVAGSPGDDQLGEIVGEIFVREHFGPAARTRMNELIAGLERALGRTLQELPWMGPQTRARAQEKLETIVHKIGAPDRWRSFAGVGISRNEFVENTLSVNADTMARQLKWIGQPIDRGLWLMTPQTVNAYYAAPLNEIVFPAGILQPPYFDVTKDDAVNFGAIGGTIGHELSHGFDDQGRKYDAKGNLTDWWTPEDDRAFRERAACVSTQYGAYPATGDTKLNGELTLGENIADNAGVAIAYAALQDALGATGPQPMIDGFTPDQRFFLAWAQVWCENATPQDFARRAQEDSHSSGRWRANGVLQNSEAFRKAFECQAGTPMAPVKVCKVW